MADTELLRQFQLSRLGRSTDHPTAGDYASPLHPALFRDSTLAIACEGVGDLRLPPHEVVDAVVTREEPIA